MKVRVLGSGTSTGVPIPGCRCDVCLSTNPRDNRLRASILLELPQHRILIDTSTDLRQQSLRAEISSIDAVLFTHTHADHVSGIDDLRSFNFINGCVIPIYGDEATCSELSSKYRYAFFLDPDYEGGSPPRLTLHQLEPYVPTNICGVEILPLPIFHGRLQILGYRIGDFAYLTDCSSIPERTKQMLHGLDTLILDGLRHRPHPTHFTIEQAVREIETINPRKAFLTHLSHEVEYFSGNKRIKELTSSAIELAYDGLEIELADK